MENQAEELSSKPKSEHLFNVVYDPHVDRFFLQDDSNQTLAVSLPSRDWIMPAKSRPQSKNDVDITAAKNSSCKLALGEGGDGPTRPNNKVPTLDFLSFQQPLREVPIGGPTPRSRKPDTLRVQDYTAHFKSANKHVRTKENATTELSDESEVKWDGEVVRVQVPLLDGEITTDAGKQTTDALQQERVAGTTDAQWAGSTFELKDLMRIRPKADGFRGPAVNSACSFVSVSSSESSGSEQEYVVPQQQESEEKMDRIPVFYRDDRVLFRARRCWLTGTIRRRVLATDFYDIRADNGSYFEAVLATKIELLDELEEPPYYEFFRGDKVLWTPDSSAEELHSIPCSKKATRQADKTEEQQTYKAKIVQVRSLDRFDLFLRTGRVVKKIPRDQLRPRDS